MKVLKEASVLQLFLCVIVTCLTMLLALFRSGIMFAFGSWSHKHPWDWPGGCSSCLLAYGLYYTLLDWQKKTTALFALCVRGYRAIGRGLSSCSRVSAIYPAALFRLKLHNPLPKKLHILFATNIFCQICFQGSLFCLYGASTQGTKCTNVSMPAVQFACCLWFSCTI